MEWELDHKECWVLKNWCFRTVMLEKTLESPLDCKEIKPVNPKENQPWIFIGRTDAEAEVSVLWPPDVTDWKRPWCWERLRARGEVGNGGWDGWMASMTQWTWVWANSGDTEGQGSLACCSSQGGQESDTTEWLNNSSLLGRERGHELPLLLFPLHGLSNGLVGLMIGWEEG